MTMTISSHNLTISWESDLQGEEVGDPPSLMTACFVFFYSLFGSTSKCLFEQGQC